MQFQLKTHISPLFTIELGRIQDFTEGGVIVGLPKAVACRGVRGHPRKFKSSEMRFPTFWGQVMVFWGHVFLSFIKMLFLLILYNFFDVRASNLGGSTEPPWTPLDPPQIESPVAQWLEHLTRSREVVGLNPIWNSDFFPSWYFYLEKFLLWKFPFNTLFN